MEEANVFNYAALRGVLREPPRFSHSSRNERFYQFSLEVARLSGAVDTIHIIARQALLESLEPFGGEKLRVKTGVGARLVITVFARELRLEDGPDENTIELRGVLCKPPNYRVTPMGREICDLMLAVRRRYGRSDYLPCIAWGTSAREAAEWDVGSGVRLTGRIQSRIYQKAVDGRIVEKTAYEVSVTRIVPEEAEQRV